MSLYELNKDMLVKLVTTIQEETEKKYRLIEKQYNALKDFADYKTIICNDKNCENVHVVSKMWASSDNFVDDDPNIQSIVCHHKHLAYCDNHVDRSKIQKIQCISDPQHFNYVCEVCLKSLNLGNDWEIKEF